MGSETTQNPWDSIIPLEPLWKQYDRIIKPNGAIILTAQGKFSAMLIMSATVPYRYSAVWCKRNTTNQLNAKKQLLRQHEDILIFYKDQPTYNPVGLVKKGTITRQGKKSTTCYGEQDRNPYMQEWTNWPTTLIRVRDQTSKTHPTEKPLELFSYLIKTFSNEGDVVLDNCSGAATTSVGSRLLGRHFICIEKDPVMYAKSLVRLERDAPENGLF
jgi:DNA modification methylase